MCGISLAIDPSPSASLLSLVARMHEPIRHRGPDGEGFLVADARLSRADLVDDLPRGSHRIAAAFRRLNILDLTSNGAQPMLSRERPIAILMNGEIYNFTSLRRELEQRGRRFRSSGDTEVALAAYETWGTDAFARLEGMWAIAIVDLERNAVVVSRDRFGIKPLFYALDGGRLLFASEAKQIVHATRKSEANLALLGMFLRGMRIPMLEETFFRGIRAVPPATWAEISLEEVREPRFRSYWSHTDFSVVPSAKYLEAVDELDAALLDAVRMHRVSDVAAGALLSGGIDSSTLAVMLTETGDPLPTFSFGFREAAPEVCEMHYADDVAKKYRLINYETTLDPVWIRENTPRVIEALEEPMLALPPLAQYRILQFCREQGQTVIIDGQGADEIFAGYPAHQTLYLRDQWRHFRLAELARETHAVARTNGRSTIGYAARGAASLFSRRNGAPPPLWIDPALLESRQDAEFLYAMTDRGDDPSLVNRQIHFDIRWGNAKTILGFGDRNGMAHSIEVRVPFFDRRIVELSLSLPDSFKIRHGDRKRVLRDVARRRLPASVTERRDRLGFGMPEDRWFRSSLWPFIKPVVTDPRLVGSSWFRRDALESFIAGFDAGTNGDARAMWRLYTTALWIDHFGVTV